MERKINEQSFKDAKTKSRWKDEGVPAFQEIESQGRRKLAMLNAATTLTDLKIPPSENLSEDERRRLHDAAQNNNTDAVKLMLAAGWPVDARGGHKMTPLQHSNG